MSMTTATSLISVELPDPFHPGWNKLRGLTVDGTHLTIDPEEYFFRRAEGVSWMICDWAAVWRDLVGVTETAETTIEQRVLDYVREHGRRTTDPAKVLSTAYAVYAHLFRSKLLLDPGLAGRTSADAPGAS
jgi:hypothetical protein